MQSVRRFTIIIRYLFGSSTHILIKFYIIFYLFFILDTFFIICDIMTKQNLPNNSNENLKLDFDEENFLNKYENKIK